MIDWPGIDEFAAQLNIADPAVLAERGSQLTQHLTAAVDHVEFYCGTVELAETPAPEGLKLAVLIIAAHLWERQRTPGSRAQVYGGANNPAMGTYRTMPNDAKKLMDPYLVQIIA